MMNQPPNQLHSGTQYQYRWLDGNPQYPTHPRTILKHLLQAKNNLEIWSPRQNTKKKLV